MYDNWSMSFRIVAARSWLRKSIVKNMSHTVGLLVVLLRPGLPPIVSVPAVLSGSFALKQIPVGLLPGTFDSVAEVAGCNGLLLDCDSERIGCSPLSRCSDSSLLLELLENTSVATPGNSLLPWFRSL